MQHRVAHAVDVGAALMWVIHRRRISRFRLVAVMVHVLERMLHLLLRGTVRTGLAP